jgi:DNA-binding MarR family transcriptional regulator
MVVNVDLLAAVSVAAPALNRVVIERLAARGFDGVKVSHGYVVQRLLVDEPTVVELAGALGMTQQGASKQVADLERLGYAERVGVAGDARARAVRLTERGRAMVEATRAVRRELETAVARRAGRAATDQATAVLTTLLDVLGLAEQVEQRRVPER